MRELLPLERHLQRVLATYASARRLFYVAFSGGKDSTALLHAACVLRDARSISETKGMVNMQVNAWHINHALVAESMQWEMHCRQECEQLNVPLVVSSLNPKDRGKESAEMFARRARYAIWRQELPPGAVLLLAHHAEDQAETLLLQLMRGNPNGMPMKRVLDREAKSKQKIASTQNFEQGDRDIPFLLRPFLQLPEAAIRDYLKAGSLRYITDPSNVDMRHERNYMRHKVLPLLKQRWDKASTNLAFAADLLTSRHKMADAHYETLLRLHLSDPQSQRKGEKASEKPLSILNKPRRRSLSIEFLADFSSAERIEILLAWLRLLRLNPPSRSLITELWRQAHAKSEAMPLLEWADGSIRRYRNHLYAMPPLPAINDAHQVNIRLSQPDSFDRAADETDENSSSLDVDALQVIQDIPLGQLFIIRVRDKGMRFPDTEERISVKFLGQDQPKKLSRSRRIRLAGREGSRSLKKALQQANIPPWLRPYLPMLYVDGELGALANIGVLPDFACKKGEGLEFVWQV